MKSMKKTIAALVAVAMIFGCVVGGTVAWLIDQTTEVQNTFTVGNIDIELTETWNTDSDKNGENDAWQGKMVPGAILDKNPTVTVKANSEACWVFVKVEKSDNLADFITYNMASGWTALDGVAGVYYRQVAATTEDTPFDVIGYGEGDSFVANKVFVNNSVTKTMMDDIQEGRATAPTLTFTAYAIQSANLTDQTGDDQVNAKDAWELVNAN